MDSTLFLGLAISLIFSFFFSFIEVAYQAANKVKIEEDAKKGSVSSKILFLFMQRPSWLIGTTRVGYCAALVFFSYFMAQLLFPVSVTLFPEALHHVIFVIFIQIILSTLLILFTAQFLPKTLGNINPNRLLLLFSIPFGISFLVLFVFTYFILSLSKLVIVYVLRLEYNEMKPLFGLTDLNQYFQTIYNVNHENGDVQVDKKILHNALEFKTVKIRECMIPRNEITAVEVKDSMGKLRQTFLESGHSKIIIYRNTIDDIIGYCHSSSLFKMPKNIEDILTSIISVPETTLANELIIRFIQEKKSLAVVMDEFGGTSGIVSREDVIEEIFGEIEDEHDEDDLIEQKLEESTFLLSARLEIDYLNEKYNWQLPIGEYETLGGLILSYIEDFPRPGETITITPYIFTIQATRDYRIDTIKVTVKQDPQSR
jgi:putative hemolysin